MSAGAAAVPRVGAMPGAAAVAWLNRWPGGTPGPAAAPDRDEPDSRPGASSGWRGNAGAGAGAMGRLNSVCRPFPASAWSGGNLRRAFMVSGEILPSYAGRGGQQRPGFPTEIAAGIPPGVEVCTYRAFRQKSPPGLADGRGRRPGDDAISSDGGTRRGRAAAAMQRAVESSNHDGRPFPRRPAPSDWAGICAVGFMVSSGRGRDSAEDVEADACRCFRRSRYRGWRMAGLGGPAAMTESPTGERSGAGR